MTSNASTTISLTLCAKCGYTAANDIEVPTSPVPGILECHRIASTSEVLIIQDTISAAEADISWIDGEITRLQAVLDGLATKRAAVQKYTQVHMALIAPVRRLPPEILSEIFLQCRATKRINLNPSRLEYIHNPRLDHTPLLLGSICTRWRAIALSTPRLWASFTLTIRPKYLKHDVLLAKTWLARTGTCPLSITLASKGRYQNAMRPLMQVFLLYCDRWYDICLSIPPPVMRSLSSAKNHLPRLQRLHISGLTDETIDIFECAPQLHYLDLSASFTPSMIKIPWNQLRYCHLRWRSVNSCLELLQLMPDLEGCTVSYTGMDSQSSHPSVQLAHLRSLNLCGSATRLLDKVILPELREVVIDTKRDTWRYTSQFISLLSRCSLEVLSFSAAIYQPSHNDMIKILETCTSLVQLELLDRISRCMTETFISRLTYYRGQENSNMPQLLPRLDTIMVDYAPSYFDMLAFADAIESRMSDNTLVAGFKRVEIRIPERAVESLDPTILSRLRRLRDNGLKITVLQGCKDLL